MPESFEEKLRRRAEENRVAFQGRYKSELNSLLGLSRDEIDEITSDTTDLEKYDELIEVVRMASESNLSQAALKSKIEQLGGVAIEIAKKIPQLATLF
ncbi:hypothetical protein [Fulvivirga lutea]|uniref:Uncharacterized protein n=1 Tax=Fulvivirga lutea TaxID=2810512 RepID=A0A974WHJ0_9BACT|nr:hypothetical protein [Fulvivirga lutea]QSE98653.1 hypothetical protein JR347_06125 [Fulvivirga lutea]